METPLFGFEQLRMVGYHPPICSTDRVSLAWWESGADDASPVFTGTTDRPRTLIVRWPTDEMGFLSGDPVAEARVADWSMDSRLFSRLAVLHREWHLGAHDLLVRGGETAIVLPCRESLLAGLLSQMPRLRQEIDEAARDLRRPQFAARSAPGAA